MPMGGSNYAPAFPVSAWRNSNCNCKKTFVSLSCKWNRDNMEINKSYTKKISGKISECRNKQQPSKTVDILSAHNNKTIFRKVQQQGRERIFAFPTNEGQSMNCFLSRLPTSVSASRKTTEQSTRPELDGQKRGALPGITDQGDPESRVAFAQA